jgi:glycosyltransferase involved in cell wall biosynthesis
MPDVTLVGLIAGGDSGVPRYASALLGSIDRVSPEFPDLSLRVLTTARGAERSGLRRLDVELVRGRLAQANAGPLRILGEQWASRTDGDELLHFFDLTGPMLAGRRRFVTTMHDAELMHGRAGVRRTHKRILQPWATSHASAIVAVSAFARDEAVRHFGADPARIEVIHSGPGLAPHARPAATREPTPYLLYVGNIAAHKNLPFLIRAFARSGADCRLVLVGSRGERFDEVQAAADDSPARERIEIRRGVPDDALEALYRQARALVLPSRYEGFGFTALEAMQRDCPVLASDIPALREISGEGAELVALDDEAAWAGAIRRVVDDAAHRESLRRRGAIAVQGYSWDDTARGVCELLRRVAGGPS